MAIEAANPKQENNLLQAQIPGARGRLIASDTSFLDVMFDRNGKRPVAPDFAGHLPGSAKRFDRQGMLGSMSDIAYRSYQAQGLARTKPSVSAREKPGAMVETRLPADTFSTHSTKASNANKTNIRGAMSSDRVSDGENPRASQGLNIANKKAQNLISQQNNLPKVKAAFLAQALRTQLNINHLQIFVTMTQAGLKLVIRGPEFSAAERGELLKQARTLLSNHGYQNATIEFLPITHPSMDKN